MARSANLSVPKHIPGNVGWLTGAADLDTTTHVLYFKWLLMMLPIEFYAT